MTELTLGFAELAEVGTTGMQAGKGGAGYQAGSIYIALPMKTYDDTALAVLKALAKQVVLGSRIDLTENQGCSPAKRGMSGGV